MEVEDDLVRHSRAGDVDAFARLVQRHQQVARRVATAVVGTDDADDVVQDAFVKAFTRLHQLDDRPFRPWLVGIVANEARNRRRAGGRRSALVIRVAVREDATDATDDPARAAELDEDRRRLAAAVATLSHRDREIVALRYLAQLSEAEAAAALGCPVGTVKSRLNRALGRLRVALIEEVPK